MLDSANLLQLDKYVKSLVYTKYAHAINLALVSYNNSWSTSCGHKTISGKLQPNSLDTYYDLDSLTTVLCTLCLMKLQQDHTIAFNDKIVKYLPDFKYDDIYVKNDEIVFRNQYIAKLFCENMLKCSKIYICNEDRFCMQF